MKINNDITRPLLRYHGGKFLLAPWIISHFPAHRVYTEVFGGAASVLLQKAPSYAEVYNDLDLEVVNLFKVVRTRGRALIKALKYTPFSREEFILSYKPTKDVFEQARRTIVRSFMGFDSGAASGNMTGFRFNSNRSGTTPAHDWKNYPEALDAIISRLQGVVIENRDALTVAKSVDGLETLHFFDPPYVPDTRYNGSKAKVYRYEMTSEQHGDLCQTILNLKGAVVLCGYDNWIYNEMLKGWQKVKKDVRGDGAVYRTEVLWINPLAYESNLKSQRQNLLFQ